MPLKSGHRMPIIKGWVLKYCTTYCRKLCHRCTGEEAFFYLWPTVIYVLYKNLPMTGFKLRTSVVGSNYSANWATATGQAFKVLQFHGLAALRRLFDFQGISERQFYKFYRRAYPSSMNPTKLSESLFRLCDLEGKSNLDFREYVASFCVYPTRYD